MADGISTLLLVGIATDLLDPLDGVRFRASGNYAAGDGAGVVFDVVPANQPDVVTLTDYPVADDPSLSDSTVGIQVRTRRAGRDPRPVKDLDDAIFGALHGWSGLLSSGVRVVTLVRRSGTSLGQDDNGRWMRSSNYYAQIHRPSPNRT